MALLLSIVIRSRPIDWLTVAAPKYDNHGGGQAMLLTQDMGRVRDRLGHCTLSINWASFKTR